MKSLMQLLTNTSLVRAPEDGTGGGSFFDPGAGGGEGGGTETVAAGDGADTVAGGDGADETPPEMPDWLLPKYHKAENPVEEQAKAYNELFRRFSKKTEDLKAEVFDEVKANYHKEIGVPDDPADYEYPEGVEPPVEEVDTAFREWAKEHGVPPEGFKKLVEEVWAKTMPDFEEETKKLGENWKERVTEVNKWAAKNIDEKHHDVLAQVMTTAAGVEFVEDLMGAKAERGFAPEGNARSKQPLTREYIREMQGDPRYGVDEAYTKQVHDYWQEFARQLERGQGR